HGANALERAEFLIENKPNKDDKMVAIAPYDIALIMGHTQTALLIANSQKKDVAIAGNSNTLFHSSVSTSQTGGIVLNQDSSYKK
ncbi:MAG: hypothetical protein WC627_13225, partial [Legionella sp.]